MTATWMRVRYLGSMRNVVGPVITGASMQGWNYSTEQHAGSHQPNFPFDKPFKPTYIEVTPRLQRTISRFWNTPARTMTRTVAPATMTVNPPLKGVRTMSSEANAA